MANVLKVAVVHAIIGLLDQSWSYRRIAGVLELGESSVNFFVRPWVKASDYWPVKCDLLEKVKLTFDDEGISIPFPQRDVHLYQVAAV